MVIGRIYFVAAPGRIKIGYTTQPERRLATLQAVDMEQLESLGTIPGTRGLEGLLHARVDAYRIKGEWFLDCAEVRQLVDDALEGKFPVPPESKDVIDGRSSLMDDRATTADILRSTMLESRRIANEISDRIKRRENVSDLVTSALFLAEHVIAPILHDKESTARIIGGLDRT